MNIYKINLNLLKVFTVLMQEQNVSIAAKRLHLTQPAISNSLQQLREIFQDELLIRKSSKMLPTRKALLIAPKISQLLNQLDSEIFNQEQFEYRTAKRLFKLGMRDYAEFMLLPKIYQAINKIAPNVTLQVVSFSEYSLKDFEERQLDLAIGLEKKIVKPLNFERLYTETAVCVARINHPIFKEKLTLERYLQSEHLAACVYSEEISRPDRVLQKQKLKRNIKLTIPNVLSAFQILANSNLLGTFSVSLVKNLVKLYKLKFVSTPFEIPEFHIAQVWHPQQDNDAGLIWLRSLIKEVCSDQFA